jgi:Arm DNA-binding domain
MHQNSGARMLTESRARGIKPRRIARKVFDGAGLYLLITPKGGRCWRYAYRFGGKHKTLALGICPDVPLERARSRHEFARNLLAHGIDPAELKAALGNLTFLGTMREWERARSKPARPFRIHETKRAISRGSLTPLNGAE